MRFEIRLLCIFVCTTIASPILANNNSTTDLPELKSAPSPDTTTVLFVQYPSENFTSDSNNTTSIPISVSNDPSPTDLPEPIPTLKPGKTEESYSYVKRLLYSILTAAAIFAVLCIVMYHIGGTSFCLTYTETIRGTTTRIQPLPVPRGPGLRDPEKNNNINNAPPEPRHVETAVETNVTEEVGHPEPEPEGQPRQYIVHVDNALPIVRILTLD